MDETQHATKRQIRTFMVCLFGGIAMLLAVIMVKDAINRSAADEQNRQTHQIVVNGGNPGYSQRQLDDVCRQYPTLQC